MEKYGFVYIWRDRKHNRYYIGAHWGTEEDGYICSSSWMRQAYRHRSSDFKRRILERIYTNRIDTFNAEQKWLDLIQEHEIKTRYYNLNIKVSDYWHKYEDKRLTISEKIAIKTKEAMQRPDVKSNYIEGMKSRDSRSSDPEVRRKRSESMKGKNKGNWDYARAAAIEAVKGKPISDSHKEKIKAAGVFSSLNSRKIACNVCGAEGNPGNIARYHNHKCKKNTNVSD